MSISSYGVRVAVLVRAILMTCICFIAPTAGFADIGVYGPVFEETGLHGAGDYYAAGSQVIVNNFGGGIHLSNTDIDIPSVGGFGLSFTRTYSTESRSTNGPLGLGWVAHYGFLRRDLSTGLNPEFINASGGREIFYLHNRSALSNLHPGGNPPSTWTWISTSLRVLQLNNQTYKMYEPSGLVYQFAPSGANNIWVPELVTDASGNTWTISYLANWWGKYSDHPLIDTIREGGSNRFLKFLYVTVQGKPRLTYVNFGSGTRQAEYTYQAVANNNFLLKEHKTPEGRKTSYTYYTDASKLAAIKTITLDTGGVTTIEYDYRWMFFPGQNVNVLAVKKITKGTEDWNYSFPNSQNGDVYTSQVAGPDGYSATYKYYTYANGQCMATDVWKVGFLFELNESYAGTSKRTNWYPGTPLQVSDESIWSNCSANKKPMAVRLDKVVEIQDGISLETVYSNYDLLFPQIISRAGNVTEQFDYKHFVGGSPYYLLGVPKFAETRMGSTLVSKTDVTSFNQGRPQTIRLHRTPNQYWTVQYTYWTTAAKAGAVRRKTQGTYTEEYDYSNGVLSDVDYPGTKPDTTRSVSPLGRVDSETTGGVLTRYAYDFDGRLEAIDHRLDSDVSITYTSNKATVTQASEKTEYIFDQWGRLADQRVLVDGQTASTRYTYDGLGRRKTETTPRNVTYTMTYDVYGRMRTRNSSQDSYTYNYQTAADRTTRTVTKNSTLTTVTVTDFLDRLLEGKTNNQSVNYSYASASNGIKQTISANSRTRWTTTDFLGNKVEEQHPEYKNQRISYEYDPRGWLTKVTQPEGDRNYFYLSDGRLDHINRDGYPEGNVEYLYDRTYGKVKQVKFGDTTYILNNFDTQGRPRESQIKVTGPKRLEAPATFLTTVGN